MQLLFRTTRQLAPTEAGRTLYQKAQELRVMANATLDSVSHLSDQISGHIRLSVPTISGELLLADAVSEFCQVHPDVTIDMTLENQLVDLVAGHYDLVIRTAQLEDSSLKAAPIFDRPLADLRQPRLPCAIRPPGFTSSVTEPSLLGLQ